MNEHYDIVIIGSGAGGGTMAHALAPTGARILILERGDFVPQEDENWSAAAVWKDLRYRTQERWLDERGSEFRPYTHYNVGGNTKFWGSVLYRLRREDFQAVQHADGVSPAWPIDYDTLAPYYDRAEQLYQVRGAVGDDPTEPPRGPYPFPPVPHAPGMARLATRMRDLGLHPSPLPLGLLNPGDPDGLPPLQHLQLVCLPDPREERRRRDRGAARDRVPERHALDQRLCAPADRRCRRAAGSRRSRSSATAPSSASRADTVIVSCGAVNSAALLLRSASAAHPDGLANSSGLVGRRYMAHLATMLEGVHWKKNADEFQKTLAINDFYLRGPAGRIRSARSSRRDGRTRSWPRSPATPGARWASRCATFRCGPTTNGCRARPTGWR